MNTGDLAARLDCSRQSIYRAQKRLGISGERYSLSNGGWGIKFSAEEAAQIESHRINTEQKNGKRHSDCPVCGERGHTTLRCPDSQEPMVCSTCGVLKPRSDFRASRRKGYGRVLLGECKPCSTARLRDRYRTDKRARFNSLLAAARSRAEKFNLAFTITADWLIARDAAQEGRCAYSGLEMSMETGKFAYSIDRKDSTQGYTQHNTVLCCWVVNHMKTDLTEEQFLDICRAVTSNAHVTNG